MNDRDLRIVGGAGAGGGLMYFLSPMIKMERGLGVLLGALAGGLITTQLIKDNAESGFGGWARAEGDPCGCGAGSNGYCGSSVGDSCDDGGGGEGELAVKTSGAGAGDCACSGAGGWYIKPRHALRGIEGFRRRPPVRPTVPSILSPRIGSAPSRRLTPTSFLSPRIGSARRPRQEATAPLSPTVGGYIAPPSYRVPPPIPPRRPRKRWGLFS